MHSSVSHLIFETARRYASSPALSLKVGFRTKTYTYSQVHDYIQKFPAFFAKHGVKRQDTIVILSQNRPEYAVLILGAFTCGVTLVPVDYRTNHETLRKFIRATKPRLIFTSRVFADALRRSDKKFFLEDLTTTLDQHAASFISQPKPEDLAAILFTSGTTGEPKGTMITYKNIISGLQMVRQVFILPERLRILSLLPLSHALEMFGGLMVAYSYGAHLHYLERVNSLTILQALGRYHIQAMAVVPQMLRLITQTLERRVSEEKKTRSWQRALEIAIYLPRPLRRLLFFKLQQSLGGSFSFFVCGSAPLEVKLSQLWDKLGIQVLEGYGASETTGFLSINTLTDNKLGTVGKVLPGITTKIISQAAIEPRTNNSGELLVSGDNIVSGYFHNPQKTAEAFPDDWFKTGDIVSLDSNQRLHIVGRDKFKIVLPDGKKVYPEDLEKKLNNHPLVLDSTVFGLKTAEGEIVHAEIITKHPDKLTSIINTVNNALNAHEQIVDFGSWKEDDFPRTKTLKVDREAVREIVEEQKNHSPTIKSTAHESDVLTKILTTVSGKKQLTVHGNTTLATDLRLDSLKRVELLALVEEDLGVSIDELKITPQTTVSELRELVRRGKPVVATDSEVLPWWQFNPLLDTIRVSLQDFVAFPLFHLPLRLKIRHPENAQKIVTPQLFIFNHVGPYDVVDVLRAIPRDIRKKTAIAATHQIWHDVWYHQYFAMLVGNAFPFIKAESGGPARGNFERVGEVLDKGYNVLISPEGNITHTGELLPFHTGAGFIALEMGVPVTPFKILGHFALWPEDKLDKLNLYWPKKFGSVEVIIGEPITFPAGTNYEQATKILRETMVSL